MQNQSNYLGGMFPTANRLVRIMPVALRLVIFALFLWVAQIHADELDDAQSEFLKGNYSEVIKTAQSHVTTGRNRYDWRILLVKSQMTVGQYKAAYTNALAGLNNYALNLDLRLLFREAALYNNRPAEAVSVLEELNNYFARRSPSYTTPDDLVLLGQTLLLLGVEPRVVLENCFTRAESLNPAPRSAYLASGQLALDKHDFKLAADKFRAGLAKFPNDPDLLSGLARAYEPSDRKEMLASLQAALDANPHHIPSILLLADHLIDAEQYDQAEKELARALDVNPHHPEALAYKAVLANLRYDTNAETAFRDHALQFYKTNPKVDYLIGLKLSQKYRFAEGSAAQRRALKFEPNYLPSRRQLAEDLLRLGQDEEGWALAEFVHKADGYDVTAYNLTTLRSQMAKYQTLSNAHFIVHMTTREAELYGDRVLALLSRARETLCQKYGIELSQPTTVEIFAEQKDFAVRTFGVPGNPGYLGVCFGSVITANSPASQAPNPANWEDVLWHEFCHVITLTATKNRMPRWLSEGISVYEERQADPTWGQKMNLANRDTILKGDITPLGQLSGAFLSSTNSAQLQFAYYESSLVIDFITERYGFESLKKILADLRDGIEINDAIAKRTAPLKDVEKQFAAFASAKAEALAPGVDFEKPPAGPEPGVEQVWANLHPKNYYVRLREAEKLMEAKKWDQAEPILESLAQSYAGERRAQNPLWLLAVTQRNLSKTNAELATLQKLAAQEDDFVDLFARLIDVSVTRKDWPAAAQYADRLLAVNPLISPPYDALAKSGIALSKPDQAIAAYRKLLLLDPPDPADVYFQLASLLHQRGGSEPEAKRHVLEALEEAPRFREAQKLLLEISAKSQMPALVPTSNPPTTPEPK